MNKIINSSQPIADLMTPENELIPAHKNSAGITLARCKNFYAALSGHPLASVIDSVRRLGLKTKWMIFTFMFVLSLSFILLTFFLKSGKRDLEKEVKSWGTSLITNLAFSVQEAVIAKDYEKLRNYLSGIKNHEDILYAAIFDDNGSLIAFQNTEFLFSFNIIDSCLNKESLTISEYQTREGMYFYNLVNPIKHNILPESPPAKIYYDPLDRVISEHSTVPSKPTEITRNKRLGTVLLGVSLENMTKKLSNMRNRAIYITFMTALVFIVFVFWAVDRISAPIKRLDKAAHKIAQGDLSHFVETDRRDELGHLARSFNEMIVRLKQSQDEVNQHTQHLEKLVAERTCDLKLSEEKYRTLFEHAGTAVALLDEVGTFLMVNKGFETLAGPSKEMLEGKLKLPDFLSTEEWKQVITLYQQDGKYNNESFPINHECTFIDRSGRKKNINLTISSIPGLSKLLVSIVDVTELRELQKRLIRSEQLAALGELSAGIAHEIRNPLVAINTSVGILKSGLKLTGEDRELMNIIAEEAMRMNKIVDDFLKFARPNEPQVIKVDLNNLIHDTIFLLKTRFDHRIQTNIQLAKNLPKILADPDQIRQVVMNMVINAIEAMPNGGSLYVSTRLARTKNGNSHIEIAINDTGPGIKGSDMKKIFQPFYSTKAQGVGMGLAICERIIQNHDGEIKVESQIGKGARFIIVLPMKTSLGSDN